MVLPGTPSGGPFGSNGLVFHDEFVTTEIGQIGTQFDGPGHIGVRTSKGDISTTAVSGRRPTSAAPATGPSAWATSASSTLPRRPTSAAPSSSTRPKYRGVNPLPIPHDTKSPGIVTADDVKAMLKAQNLAEPEAGDCVFLYTGHGDLWKNSVWKSMSAAQRAEARAKFTAGEPGFGRSACEYLAERKISFMGGDTSANDAQPVGEIEGEAVPCHQVAQTHHGIWNIENLDFEPLLNEGVYEFLLVWAPLKIVGGTGSPGNPVAIW